MVETGWKRSLGAPAGCEGRLSICRSSWSLSDLQCTRKQIPPRRRSSVRQPLDSGKLVRQTLFDAYAVRSRRLEKGLPRMTEYQTLLVKFQPRPISSAVGHARMLKQIEQLMNQPQKSRAEHELLEILSTLVEQYELKHLPSPDVSPEEMLAHCIAA